MATTLDERFAPAIEKMAEELALIEEKVVTGYTLADAIREGSSVTTQEYGWGHGENACALSAGCIAAKARGYSS
jgi:hypothetical protein